MDDEDRVSERTSSASSLIVNSVGLPKLTGPVNSGALFIRHIRPSIRSST